MSTGIPAHLPTGLLPPGIHRASLSDVHHAFVQNAGSNPRLRQAVFDGVTAWIGMAPTIFGAGTAWLSGGFISTGEPTDTAWLAYEPEDRGLALQAARSGLAHTVLSLSKVIYSYPPPGGGTEERWAVSALVDAHLIDRGTKTGYRHAWAAVLGVDGVVLEGVTKGFIEIEVASHD
ncbi:hypothetical protein [Cellulomonas sp. B6]|uniref:DUF6932 family protein n=1 Tax=Cellulomonas sp. B6 TaxID=1295626 RepID=UPI00073BD06E|nr:hypothetical protein [Cellulomonas sp. B6]KSW28569.1 hypothetical protein ATM99_11135 [Cellulomonas sp. B6]